MQQLIIIILCAIGLFSCNNIKENPIDESKLTKDQLSAKIKKLKLDFNQPILIDSSVYVMYPLTLEINDEPESSFGSSSRYSEPTTYWNIVFYNTFNGNYHLLSESTKMVIYSYNPRNSENEGSSSSAFGLDTHFESGYNQVDRLLYYAITTNDFNKDGKLNTLDPSYLFISDKSGNHFKQVSPDNLNVNQWVTIKGANKILLMVTRDINGDKIFDNRDETYPLVYDLTKNTISSEVFNNDFKMKLKRIMAEQWTKN